MNANLLEVKGQEITVLFLDAAGTLIHLTQSVGWHYSEEAARRGLSVSPEDITNSFGTIWKQQKDRPATPGPRDQDDKLWWKQLAISTLEKTISVPANFDRDGWFESVYTRFEQPGIWVLYDDARPFLEKHHGKVRMAVLSNFDRRLRRILAHLGVAHYFEQMIISSEVGCDKPDRAIFEQGLEVMGVTADRCVHIGDEPEKDWAGAEAAGIRVFRIRRPQVTLDHFSLGREGRSPSEPR